MNLTKKRIDRAEYDPEGPSRQVLWDDTLPGFGLRLFPSGRKGFVVFYRTGRRQRLMSVGSYGVMTVQEARDQARKTLVAAKQGDDPLQQRQKAARASTFREFSEQYIEQHARPKKKSWRNDQQRLKRHILPTLGSLPLEKITPEDINRLYHRIGSDRPIEANRVRSLLQTMFNLAAAWGLYPPGAANPARLPRGMRFREQSRDRPVTSAELPRLMEAIEEEEDPWVRGAVRLFLLTGLRKREVLWARWQDVDFQRAVLRLADTKAGKPRHVPLSGPALRVIRDLPRFQGNAYLFPSPVKEGAPRIDLFKPWRRIRKRAGCTDLRIHDLRHSVATWLAEEGHAAQFIQQALGHQSLQTTMKYVHAAGIGPRNALEGLGARLLPD